MRLRFFWWGWRRIRFGPGWNLCADKDFSVKAKTFDIGPLQIEWWDRSNWRDYCYTEEEAAEIDRS